MQAAAASACVQFLMWTTNNALLLGLVEPAFFLKCLRIQMNPSVQNRLRAVVLNLAVLEAIKDYDKLRILPNDPEESLATPVVNVKQSHLAIDERSFMQGTRRAMSGDGHSTSIAFVRKVIEEVREIANHAFSTLSEHDQDAKLDLFDETPRQILHELSCACTSAKKGIDRLRQTTYADSQQIGVELADINREFDAIINNVSKLLTAESK